MLINVAKNYNITNIKVRRNVFKANFPRQFRNGYTYKHVWSSEINTLLRKINWYPYIYWVPNYSVDLSEHPLNMQQSVHTP